MFLKEEGAWGWEWGACDFGPPRVITFRSDGSDGGNEPKSVVARAVRVALTVTDKAERSNCMKLCLRLGQSCSEIDSMIQEAFGNKPVGRTQVTEWFRLFKKGTDVSHK